MNTSPNPEEFGKYYNTQPNQIPFRKKSMKETLWRLEDEEWPCYYKHDGVWVRTTLFRGFVCDLASIPWVTQPIIKKGKDGVHRNGTTNHDFNYVMEKVMHNGSLCAKIEAFSCTHKNEAWVDGKWIPFDMFVTKEQADQYMFDIIESTEKAYIRPWVKKSMLLAFKTKIARKKWEANWKLTDVNPSLCK